LYNGKNFARGEIMSDFKCPKCGAENIQSYEVIYNSGRASHTSTTDGVSVGSDWSVGRATTEGNSITNLAQTCAPPVREVYNGYGIFIIYGIFASVLGAMLFFIHPAASVIGVCFPLYKWVKKVKRVNSENYSKYLQDYKQWQKLYYCSRCGNRFMIK